MDNPWEILDRIANAIEVAWFLHLIYQNRHKLTRSDKHIRRTITDNLPVSDSINVVHTKGVPSVESVGQPTVIPEKNPTEVRQELLWWYVLINQNRSR